MERRNQRKDTKPGDITIQLTVYLNGTAGFALGGPAKTVPQEYVDQWKNGEMDKLEPSDFKRVINRLNEGRLKNMAPAYARITNHGTLILE